MAWKTPCSVKWTKEETVAAGEHYAMPISTAKTKNSLLLFCCFTTITTSVCHNGFPPFQICHIHRESLLALVFNKPFTAGPRFLLASQWLGFFRLFVGIPTGSMRSKDRKLENKTERIFSNPTAINDPVKLLCICIFMFCTGKLFLFNRNLYLDTTKGNVIKATNS